MDTIDPRPTTPVTEKDRLARLKALDILDTPPEESFERLTRMASTLLEVPISAVSLIDENRQWFKSVVGLDTRETTREVAFCAHAMRGDTVMEVRDATVDPRFADNPLVTGDPGIRFYAGAPLKTRDGVPLGSLCVIDRKPRTLTATQLQVLQDLAAMAVDAIDLRTALRDATDREEAAKIATAALAASEAAQRAVLDTAVDAIITIDERGIIRTVNPATVRLFGYREEEMVGRNVSMLMPEPHAAAHDAYMARYHRTDDPHIIGVGREVPARRKDGTLFQAELAVSEMRVNGVRGYTGILRDITRRCEIEDEVREKNRLLGMAEEVGQVGHWRVEEETRAVEWSDGMYRIYGLDRDSFTPTVDTVMTRMPERDRERVATAVAATRTDGVPFTLDHAIILPDGTERVVSSSGRQERDEAGNPVALFGIMQDITDRVRAQERLQVAIDHISDGFVLMDEQDRIVVWNDKMLFLYPRAAPLVRMGIKFEDLVRRGVDEGQYPNAIGREEEFIAERMARHRLREEDYEERLVDADGRERYVRVTERNLPDGGRVGIRTDVTDLRVAQREADAANQAKSAFLSSMSHELRTPLNAVLGFAQLLEVSRKDPLSEKQQSHVKQILKGGQHLLDLINEVLDLARIEAGKMTLSIEDIDAADVLGECLPLAETLADKRAITIRVDVTDPAPRVRADFTRFKQVLLNLLSNAVKYNRESGRIIVTVAVDLAKKTARFSVADTGQGIPPEHMDGLFEPFNRLGAEATEVEGTGIGLTLTRELVERMDGAIGVESTVGKGSTFWVEVPLAENCPAGAAAAREAQRAAQALEAGEGALLDVLYVEDNPANMRLMEEVMEDFGTVQLQTAHTAELGLEMIACDRPDLVIMDINLPGIDGIEAVRRLRADPATAELPVIGLSANATAASIQKGLDAGFNAYLTKPVVIPELMGAIDRALKETSR
ncbi:PAS domain S-box protein [Caenispirillum salinarum]|uniref:PAS domain S-box protein n=1 Tax=Caenispirillum salinarum TaxID=859058 RepID=UPI001267424C|nr:PAS domain S-box protein [Caenispirillum salinarum]